MIRHLIKLVWNRKRKNALLTGEILLSFLILFAASSAIIYFFSLYKESKGFDHYNLWVVHMNNLNADDSVKTVTIHDNLRRDLEALPEVEAVSFTGANTPYSGNTWQYNSESNGVSLNTHYFLTDEQFANVLKMNIVEGRWFEEGDRNAKDALAVITKKIADELFKDTTAIGSVIPIENAKVIGVIDHYKYRGEFVPEFNSTFVLGKKYEPNFPNSTMMIKISEGVPPAFEEQVNELIQSVTGGWPFIIRHIDSARRLANKKIWIPMILIIAICLFLIFNVALGLFGVLWYNISYRKSEIGLRRAVGATTFNISIQLILEMILIATLGIIIGGFFAAQVPILKMFNVDSWIFIKAILISSVFIYLLVLICTLYPSAQAGIIQPATALHDE